MHGLLGSGELVIRVFPRRTSYTPTDDLAFVGDPLLMRPDADEVHISCVFTWEIPEAERLADSWGRFYPVKLGGPAFDDPGGEFTPGRYVREGITITSRGCPRRCSFCYVPRREGRLRELQIKPGNVITDNNLLACSESHIKAVFKMLATQRRIVFSGGLDARMMTSWQAEWIEANQTRIKELYFAADRDTHTTWDALEKVSEALPFLTRRKKRCYVLIGWGEETIEAARKRLQMVWDLGFMPFAQFYRGPDQQDRTKDWRELQNIWTRPARMKAANRLTG